MDKDIPRLFEMTDLVTPMALRVAATLRLPDLVDSGVTSVPALAEQTGAVPRVLAKVVDHLVALDILGCGPDGDISVTPFGAPLLSGWEDGGFRASLDLNDVAGRADMSITGLLHTVLTGQTSYEGIHGTTLWDDVNDRAEPGSAELASLSPVFDAHLVIDSYDWSRHGHVVDVGGNNGALLGALLHAHPHLRGTLLDLGKFAEQGNSTLRHWDVRERAEIAEGSFFDAPPADGDVYLLSAILADWDDEHAVAILRGCAQAAGPGGRVLLAEVHMTEHEQLDPPLRTAMALRWEASMTRPDRTVEDLCALAERAGLSVLRRGPESPVRSVLELGSADAGARR